MMNFSYSDRGSAIHLLNPLVKMGWVMSLVVLTFILEHPLALLGLFLVTLPPVIFAGVRREWSSFMRYSLLLCLTIIIINCLFSPHGDHVLLSSSLDLPVIGTPRVTLEALVFGLSMSLRLLAVISAFALFTLTVHPDDILQALLKLKMPYKSVLVAALSTRFVPLLIDDAERIRDLQRSRGLDTGSGNILRRTGKQAAVLVPLLSNSLDRTAQLAEAMEARGFGSGRGRSFYKPLKLSRLDKLALTFTLLPLVPAIALRLSGPGSYSYYPSLGPLDPDPLAWSLLALVLFLLGLIVPLATLQKGAAA
jgi:energy-coupling factor transport system permease protein